jgi:hypothetical protein
MEGLTVGLVRGLLIIVGIVWALVSARRGEP